MSARNNHNNQNGNSNNHTNQTNKRMNLKNKSSASYMAMTSSGAVQRIRTPSVSDILLGRGGSINNHPGNQVFREWVKARREDYNLAPNKVEKMKIARKVMDSVHHAGGRFLQKDPSTSAHWWVEVDETRALAKTAQALREGAPQIRAAHHPEDPEPPARKRRSAQSVEQQGRKRTRVETPPPLSLGQVAVSPEPYRTATAIKQLHEGFQKAQRDYRPLMSNTEFQVYKSHENPNPQDDCTTPRPHHHGHEQDVYLEEIPNLLTSIPHMPHELRPSDIQEKSEDVSDSESLPPPIPPRMPPMQPMERFNSLVWTNNGDWGSSDVLNELDFVNPFLDETDVLGLGDGEDKEPSNETPTIVRNLSTERTTQDGYDQLNSLYGFSNVEHTNQDPSENCRQQPGDFNEEIMQIYDQANNNGKEMPTLLLPFRGGALQERYVGRQNTCIGSEKNAFGTTLRRSVSPH